MKESRVVAAVLASLKRLPGCYAWRNNTGAAVIRGRVVRFGTAGSADILCCYRGHFIAIECKAPNGKLSPLQRRWGDKIEAAGGHYFVARSADDVSVAIQSVV